MDNTWWNMVEIVWIDSGTGSTLEILCFELRVVGRSVKVLSFQLPGIVLAIDHPNFYHLSRKLDGGSVGTHGPSG